MPPERTQRPRQEPVSCQSCRRKKLKCDRLEPCHGCASRGLQCVYAGGAAPTAFPTATASHDTFDSLRAENKAIRARLQALEKVVYDESKPRMLPSSADTTPILGDDCTHPPIPTLADPASIHSVAQQFDYSHSNYQWLKGSGSVLDAMIPTKELRILVRPLCSIVEQICTNKDPPSTVLLPSRTETITLFHDYTEQLAALQHVFHVPTVRATIDELYNAIEDNGKVKHSHLALLLGILASLTALYGLIDVQPNILGSCEQPFPLAMYWLRCSLDTLEYIWRILYPDLETVQATILNVFSIYQTEGLSSRARYLQATAVANARSIGLYLTDSPANSRVQPSRATIIETEVRRRVWWHLAATEWSLSACGGPHEGTYLINPKHMHVIRPRNLTEEDLLSQPSDFERPMSTVTPMSYYIVRIRLSELYRDAADIAWELLTVRDAASISYERVLGLDRRLVGLSHELPDFLRYEINECLIERLHTDVSPQIAKQKVFTYLMITARRCKLHLPYLLRSQVHSRFSHSRKISIDCAREMLRLKQIMASESTACNIKLPNVLHHFFIAILVLVVDFCVNEHAGDEDTRKAEIQEACKILTNAKKRSAAASSFLDSLDRVLQKHRMRLKDRMPHLDESSKAAGAGENDKGWRSHDVDTVTTVTGNGILHAAAFNQPEIPLVDQDDIDFEQIWQGYVEFGAYADPQSWDALVSDLQMNLE